MLTRFWKPSTIRVRWCIKCDNFFIGKDICHNEYPDIIIDRERLLKFLNSCCHEFNIDEISFKEDIEIYADAYIKAYSNTNTPISNEINALEIVELLFANFCKKTNEFYTLEAILNECDEMFAIDVQKLCTSEQFIYKINE